MILPPTLRPGDRVGVVAPSSPLDEERLRGGLDYLRNQGYEVVEGASLHLHDRYLAGSDRERAEDLEGMFGDPTIRAIFAARGGYGSARVLDSIDYDTVRRAPTNLVGFSDTTALQLGFYTHTGLVTYSGFVLGVDVREGRVAEETESSLWAALNEHAWSEMSGLHPVRSGAAFGPVLGGCLSVLTSLVGTPHLPSLEGCILILEDVNEAPYRIDRMLTQLRSAGAFRDAAAILFGGFLGSDEKADREDGNVGSVIEAFAEDVRCPVYSGLPYGHEEGRIVVPIGWKATLESGTLRFTAAQKENRA